MSDEFLTLRETAALTKFAEPTLRKFRWAGTGPPSFRVAGRVRYRRSAVEEWMRQQEEIESEKSARIHRARTG
jgi:predicted DNA-binding transcriptional regulator AlpA